MKSEQTENYISLDPSKGEIVHREVQECIHCVSPVYALGETELSLEAGGVLKVVVMSCEGCDRLHFEPVRESLKKLLE